MRQHAISPATPELQHGLQVRSRPARSNSAYLHLSVWFHRRRLDALLVNGADADSDPQLAVRARQITAEAYLRALADSFERLLATAESPPRPRASSAVPPARRAVRRARPELLDLCRMLRECAAPQPGGSALAQMLLTDGSSPLYLESTDEGELERAVRRATSALEGRLDDHT
jgi:hypothetical protein